MKKMRIDIILMGLMLLGLMLSACSTGEGAVPSATESRVEEAGSTVLAPTATPQPEGYVLIAPAGHSLLSIDALSDFLAARAAAEGARFVQATSPDGIPDGLTVRVIVFVDQPAEASAWASAQPDTQVIAIPGPSGEGVPNLLALGQEEIDPRPMAFLSGYAAALLAPDWRTAILTDSTSSRDGMGAAFYQGATFFCGLCRPERPPYEDYPLIQSLAPTDDEAWQATLDTLQLAGVDVVYIDGGLVSPERLSGVAERGMLALTSQPVEGASNLALVLLYDPVSPLQQHWDDVLTGLIGGEEALPFLLLPGAEELISTGRLNLIRQTADDLELGFIGIVE